jgi:hypothetical protein
MIHKLRTFQALNSSERACLLRALRLLPAVRMSLRLIGTRRTQAWLARSYKPPALSATRDEARIRQVVRMVRVAQRYHRFWSNCLSHSLTLWSLLRHEGFEADVRIGARLQNGKLQAHAWVEWQGRVLNDASDGMGDFTPFDRPLLSRSR